MGTPPTIHQVEALMGKEYVVRITPIAQPLKFQDFSLTIDITANGERNNGYFYWTG